MQLQLSLVSSHFLIKTQGFLYLPTVLTVTLFSLYSLHPILIMFYGDCILSLYQCFIFIIFSLILPTTNYSVLTVVVGIYSAVGTYQIKHHQK